MKIQDSLYKFNEFETIIFPEIALLGLIVIGLFVLIMIILKWNKSKKH